MKPEKYKLNLSGKASIQEVNSGTAPGEGDCYYVNIRLRIHNPNADIANAIYDADAVIPISREQYEHLRRNLKSKKNGGARLVANGQLELHFVESDGPKHFNGQLPPSGSSD